jgi:hypothetical protein
MAKKRKLYANASYEDMVCVLESNKHLDITQYAKKLRMQKHQRLCDVVVKGKRFGDLPISKVDHHHVQVALQSVWQALFCVALFRNARILSKTRKQ